MWYDGCLWLLWLPIYHPKSTGKANHSIEILKLKNGIEGSNHRLKSQLRVGPRLNFVNSKIQSPIFFLFKIIIIIIIILFINLTTLQQMMKSWGRGLQDTKSYIKTSLTVTRNTHAHAHTHTRKTAIYNIPFRTKCLPRSHTVDVEIRVKLRQVVRE